MLRFKRNEIPIAWAIIGLIVPILLWPTFRSRILFAFLNPFGYILANHRFEFVNYKYIVLYAFYTSLLYFIVAFIIKKVREKKYIEGELIVDKRAKVPYIILLIFICLFWAILLCFYLIIFVGFALYGPP